MQTPPFHRLLCGEGSTHNIPLMIACRFDFILHFFKIHALNSRGLKGKDKNMKNPMETTRCEVRTREMVHEVATWSVVPKHIHTYM